MEGISRRNRIDLFTPAETAIHQAMQAVEEAGCHPLLTEAVILLGQAREKVSDYVDSSNEVMMEGLTEGKIVLYVLPSGNSEGQVRPAIVVRVWRGADGKPQANGICQLQVLTDSSNDYPSGESIQWRTSVAYNKSGELGTWHWISEPISAVEERIVGEVLTTLRAQSYEQELFTTILPQLAREGYSPEEAAQKARDYAIAGAALYPDDAD